MPRYAVISTCGVMIFATSAALMVSGVFSLGSIVAIKFAGAGSGFFLEFYLRKRLSLATPSHPLFHLGAVFLPSVIYIFIGIASVNGLSIERYIIIGSGVAAVTIFVAALLMEHFSEQENS